jgi:hypothetical protein
MWPGSIESLKSGVAPKFTFKPKPPPLMPGPSRIFAALTGRDLQAINRLTRQLLEVPDLQTLGREFLQGMAAVLQADCTSWNVWTPAMDSILSYEVNHEDYRDVVERYSESLNATIHHHPVIAAGKLDSAWQRPQRMSDYQSFGTFKSNPLFREVYRHLDSHHQLAYTAARLDDSLIILSWNRKARDFTDRDCQRLHLMGLRVRKLSERLQQTQRLNSMWDALASGLAEAAGLHLGPAGTHPHLSEADGTILAGLIGGRSRDTIAASLQWRRDTLDRQLAAIRERLGFENSSQMLSVLAALRPATFSRTQWADA